MKKYLKIFFQLWLEIIIFMIPLYIVLFLGLLPIQLGAYLKIILILIAVILFFKGVKIGNKKIYYFLLTTYIAILIFSFIMFKTFNVKSSLNYFKNEGIYYPNEFKGKIGIDLNYDGFIDLRYNM